MKIDIYNHVMPVKFLEQMKELGADANLLKRMSSIRMLWDIEARVEMLKSKFPEVQQVLTLSVPSPEMVGGPDKSPMLVATTRPALGLTRPFNERSKVDLPAPDAPSRTTNSPCMKLSEVGCRARAPLP